MLSERHLCLRLQSVASGRCMRRGLVQGLHSSDSSQQLIAVGVSCNELVQLNFIGIHQR